MAQYARFANIYLGYGVSRLFTLIIENIPHSKERLNCIIPPIVR